MRAQPLNYRPLTLEWLEDRAVPTVINAGFETGDFTGWNTTGVAQIKQSSFGSGPASGDHQALITTGGSQSQSNLENFLNLRSGDLDQQLGVNVNVGSAIRQQVTVEANEEYTFAWNFFTETTAGNRNNDQAGFIVNGQVIQLADINSPSVVSETFAYPRETGIQTYTHRFASAGTFWIGFFVVDVESQSSDSALSVDLPAPMVPQKWDFGDAAASYGTAQHQAIGVQLGTGRDFESVAPFSPLANGDDITPSGTPSDEDGLLAQPFLFVGETGALTLTIQGVSNQHYLNAWVDWSRDGDFDDTVAGVSEQIALDLPVTADGPLTVEVSIPTGLLAANDYVARFRINDTGGLDPTGIATEGEVEDHLLTILQRPEFVAVAPTFTEPAGTVIDGNLYESGIQSAVIGFTAFHKIADALAMVADSGTLLIHDGIYLETVHLQESITFQFADLTVDAFEIAAGVDVTFLPIAAKPIQWHVQSNVTLAGNLTIAPTNSSPALFTFGQGNAGQFQLTELATLTNSNGDLTLRGGASDDLIQIAGQVSAAGSMQLDSGAGVDRFELTGTLISPALITVHGGAGPDDFLIRPQATQALLVEGANPMPGDGVDRLELNAANQASLIQTGVGAGEYLLPGAPGVRFTGIEQALGNPLWTFFGDFNGTSAVTQSGFQPISAGQRYTPGGFGWIDELTEFYDGPAKTLDRQGHFFTQSTLVANLLRDGVWGRSNSNPNYPWLNDPHEFRIDLPAGEYNVALFMGDTYQRNFLQVRANKTEVISGVGNEAGEWGQYRFTVQIADDGAGIGSLTLEFATTDGDKYWVVNGLTIIPTVVQNNVTWQLVQDTPAIQNADGFSKSTVLGTLDRDVIGPITISASMGTIAPELDVDPYLKGVQVTPSNRQFQIELKAPSIEGVEQLHADGVLAAVSQKPILTGQAANPLLTYTLISRRFDFNHRSSKTISPTADNWLAVPVTAYNEQMGFGYATSDFLPAGFDRQQGTDSLTRDGHFGKGNRPSTFQIQVAPNQDYEVTIHFGDLFAARPGMQVRFEQGPWQHLPGLGGTQLLAQETFLGIRDSNGDGRLSVSFKIDPFFPGHTGYWTINGLKIERANNR